CTCELPEFPCFHILGVYYLMADRIARDPFLLFQLRGRGTEAVIAGVRAAMGEWEPEVSALPSSAADLTRRLGTFFSGDVDAIPAGLPRFSAEPPVLRRLGTVPASAQSSIVNALRIASVTAE